MAKKPLTQEQKDAMKARLDAGRKKAAEKRRKEQIEKAHAISMQLKAQKAVEETPTVENTEPAPEVVVAEQVETPVIETVKSGEESQDDVLKRALEAIEVLAKLTAQNAASGNNNGPALGANGRIQGVITKASINPADYPDPTDRIKEEQRLAPYAFSLNYDMTFKVTSVQYETKAGVNYIEPQFNIELLRVVRDDSTGEDTGRRYVIGKLVIHDDPQTALMIAHANGFDSNAMSETDLLNEMRYIQIRDWVFESFFAPLSVNREDRSEMVVNGKVVQFFEVNSQDKASKLPFGELKRF